MVKPAPADTRERLLEVAGPMFAARGFRETGIKEICDAAGCNVAAVNYHFDTKQDFYAAVLAAAHQQAFTHSPMPAADADTAPEDALADWLRWWIGSMLHPARPVWLQTLMAREMVDPTPALDAMVDRSIRPLYEHLTGLVRRLLPQRTKRSTLRNAVNSVIGQVLVHKHAEVVLDRLGARADTSPASLKILIEHIITFSLAGIAAASGGGTARAQEQESA